MRNVELLRDLHIAWRGDCALDGRTRGLCDRTRYSLHHVHKHPRDDMESNLVMLCGDGTRGHHGMIEAGNRDARAALGLYILDERRDVIDYLTVKLGGAEQARAWLQRSLYAAA